MNRSKAIQEDNIQWFQQQLLAWANHNFRDFPWRHTQDPYAIFAAECLLQKTTALQAERTYRQFLATYPTIHALAQAEIADLTELLKPLGMTFRAARFLAAAQMVANTYGGKFPETETELLKLPGVGKYVARSILANAFNQATAVLDRNVARILERFFGVEGGRVKTRDLMLWDLSQQVAPATAVSRWNLTLIDFGAAVCTARQPACQTCLLQTRCCWVNLGSANPK